MNVAVYERFFSWISLKSRLEFILIGRDDASKLVNRPKKDNFENVSKNDSFFFLFLFWGVGGVGIENQIFFFVW